VDAARRACLSASDDRRSDEGIARWREAARALHACYEAVWPPGFWVAHSKAQQGVATGAELELLVGFLEADPIFFRSGYFADKVVRFVGRSPLSPDHAARLRAVLLDAVDRRHRQYFRRFCALARRLDEERLRAELVRRLESADAKVAVRAHWMLEGLELPKDAKSAPDYESLLRGMERKQARGRFELWPIFVAFSAPPAVSEDHERRLAAVLVSVLGDMDEQWALSWCASPARPMFLRALDRLAPGDGRARRLRASLPA
jgi:hypothetical protein